jgi:glucokinase
LESGLGVAAFTRDEDSLVTILPTEAGHSELVDASPDMAPIISFIRDRNRYCSAETLLSSGGLAAIYNALAEQQGVQGRAERDDEVIREAGLGDGTASKAVTLFAKAVWRFAGNLTLIYGAWDGIFLTGSIVSTLRKTLSQQDVRQSFAITGPYANLLRTVPAGFFVLEHSALRGAAEAIRRQA